MFVVVKPKIVISWFHSFYKVMDFDLIWFKSVFENSSHTLRAPVRWPVRGMETGDSRVEKS